MGRKKAILAFALSFLLSWALLIFANSAYTLYAGRFFAGIATGAMCVLCPMYIGEIAETSIRGALGSFFQMFICFGILITYFIGAFVKWQALSTILALAPITFIVVFYFMPETPTYLLKINEVDEAEKNLKYFRGIDYNVTSELKQLQRDIEEAASKQAGLKDLVASRANRKALVSALGLMLFQQLSGVNAVIFYTVSSVFLYLKKI